MGGIEIPSNPNPWVEQPLTPTFKCVNWTTRNQDHGESIRQFGRAYVGGIIPSVRRDLLGSKKRCSAYYDATESLFVKKLLLGITASFRNFTPMAGSVTTLTPVTQGGGSLRGQDIAPVKTRGEDNDAEKKGIVNGSDEKFEDTESTRWIEISGPQSPEQPSLFA